jgi:hypothetical protein
LPPVVVLGANALMLIRIVPHKKAACLMNGAALGQSFFAVRAGRTSHQ